MVNAGITISVGTSIAPSLAATALDFLEWIPDFVGEGRVELLVEESIGRYLSITDKPIVVRNVGFDNSCTCGRKFAHFVSRVHIDDVAHQAATHIGVVASFVVPLLESIFRNAINGLAEQSHTLGTELCSIGDKRHVAGGIARIVADKARAIERIKIVEVSYVLECRADGTAHHTRYRHRGSTEDDTIIANQSVVKFCGRQVDERTHCRKCTSVVNEGWIAHVVLVSAAVAIDIAYHQAFVEQNQLNKRIECFD